MSGREFRRLQRGEFKVGDFVATRGGQYWESGFIEGRATMRGRNGAEMFIVRGPGGRRGLVPVATAYAQGVLGA